MGPKKMLIVLTSETWRDCYKVDICVTLPILGDVCNSVCERLPGAKLSVAVHGVDERIWQIMPVLNAAIMILCYFELRRRSYRK